MALRFGLVLLAEGDWERLVTTAEKINHNLEKFHRDIQGEIRQMKMDITALKGAIDGLATGLTSELEEIKTFLGGLTPPDNQDFTQQDIDDQTARVTRMQQALQDFDVTKVPMGGGSGTGTGGTGTGDGGTGTGTGDGGTGTGTGDPGTGDGGTVIDSAGRTVRR